jgi:hypothetical protein
VADDNLELLKRHDESIRLRLEQRDAAQAARDASIEEWNDAWEAVYRSLHISGHEAQPSPDLSPLIQLAKVLRKRQYDIWLPEMASNIAKILDDAGQFRPGQLFFIELLLAAGKPRATKGKLASIFESYKPFRTMDGWQERSAREVYDFIKTRIQSAKATAETIAQEELNRKAADRDAALIKATKRRTSIRKQIFAVYWNDRGMKPAKIRDAWNQAHPKESLGKGRAGRRDIRVAIERGREFFAKNETTAVEMASLLAITL